MNALDPPAQRLLVVLPRPLGDAVLAVPALEAIRARLPGAWIAWGGNRAALDALAGHAACDAMLPLGRAVGRGWRTRRRVARRLRDLAFDAALVLPNSVSSAFEPFLARISRRVGTGRGFLRRRLLTHVVVVPRGPDGGLVPRPMEDLYLDLAAPLGVDPSAHASRRPRLVVQSFDRERAALRLAALGDAPLLGIQPGAAFGPSKQMPVDRLAAAVRRLATEDGWQPLVLVGPGEEGLGADLAAAIGPGTASTHEDPPDVGTLKGLLERCSLVLSADAGPRHVAEALGRPVVAFLGPTDPRWSGRSAAHVVRREDLACLACHERECPLGHHACLSDLDPERLVAAVRTAAGAMRGG